jgi:ribosome-binding protein aMBF1 (putative translation factor)
VSTATTLNAWKERERAATLVLAVAARRQAIMDRMLRYRVENARPEDKQKGKPLPQEQAARRADVDSRQWQRWETGETMPHQSNLQQLATKLRIPIAEFYDAEEPEETRGDTQDLGATFNGEDDQRSPHCASSRASSGCGCS